MLSSTGSHEDNSNNNDDNDDNDNNDNDDDNDRKYRVHRYMNGLWCDPREIYGKIPLECNMDLLEYISFSKGCYIGQELIARTKYKGTLYIYVHTHIYIYLYIYT